MVHYDIHGCIYRVTCISYMHAGGDPNFAEPTPPLELISRRVIHESSEGHPRQGKSPWPFQAFWCDGGHCIVLFVASYSWVVMAHDCYT